MPRNITVTFDDGSTHVYQNAPDDVSPDAVHQRAQQEYGKAVKSLYGGRQPNQAQAAPEERSMLQSFGEGALRGAAGIGNTLLSPVRGLANLVAPEQSSLSTLVDGKKTRSGPLAPVADYLARIPESMKWLDQENASNPISYGAGKLGTEIAMTAPVGGVIGKGLAKVAPMLGGAAPVVNKLAQATASGGMRLGGPAATTALGWAGDTGLRMAGGAINGAATAGLVDPESAGTGAMIGGAIPGGVALAGAAGRGIRNSLAVSPEVGKLAQRAKELGIDVPVDRIAQNKPLNALAASLEYVPLSGRAATTEKMGKQLNTALARTFGQNTDNLTVALDQASKDLGGKFDAVLQSNSVKMTPAFKTALAEAEDQAANELGPEAASIIHKQIAQLQTKGAAGEIDGQVAYNIKKSLDRIGSGKSDAAFYARDLKRKLMDALNDSLGPDEAKSFAEVRKQYGNMMEIDKLVQNGAEGGVSAARLGNLRNIRSADLQELADISAQFLKTRESPHGALQRLVIGGTAGSIGGAAAGLGALPYLGAAAVAGRGANATLNSNTLRNALINSSKGATQLPSGDVSALAQLLAKSAPVALTPSGRQ